MQQLLHEGARHQPEADDRRSSQWSTSDCRTSQGLRRDCQRPLLPEAYLHKRARGPEAEGQPAPKLHDQGKAASSAVAARLRAPILLNSPAQQQGCHDAEEPAGAIHQELAQSEQPGTAQGQDFRALQRSEHAPGELNGAPQEQYPAAAAEARSSERAVIRQRRPQLHPAFEPAWRRTRHPISEEPSATTKTRSAPG